MNSGNFGKHGINLHALELALRSKWRRRTGGRWSWEYPPKPLCIQNRDFALLCFHVYFHNDTESGAGGKQN